MDQKQFFECLKCGHFTQFDLGTRPRCEGCGCMTGLVEKDTASPLFRFAKERAALAARRTRQPA